MAITIVTSRKDQYAILRTSHSYTSTDMRTTRFNRYVLVEVHAATRDGKVKEFRRYGETGSATNLRSLGADAVFFALTLGRPWSATGTYDTMAEICAALNLQLGAYESLIKLDAAIA